MARVLTVRYVYRDAVDAIKRISRDQGSPPPVIHCTACVADEVVDAGGPSRAITLCMQDAFTIILAGTG